MVYTLAFVDSPVPSIPPRGAARPPAPSDRREHFGTPEAALRRAAAMMPVPAWRRLRLFGPDGALIADHAAILARLEAEPRRG
ncbi:hypothetical protein FHR90_001021 [Endobacter medicaginis]|uniref:Uncharacterized protein n=2 Tax=Endobacter medicaginis TaxID=1181271 RepID=A0A839UXV5_9PROT|nr:hypothetical protein [Endobacter medicaginis]MBB3173203.1 hypothetical protein [Endobacter medicaginis]MCX5476627.1 hypothetical protein [Endobacter medicaginis]